MGLIYVPRELPGVTTIRPRIAGVLHFTSNFWSELFKLLDTKLCISSALAQHIMPNLMDRQRESTNAWKHIWGVQLVLELNGWSGYRWQSYGIILVTTTHWNIPHLKLYMSLIHLLVPFPPWLTLRIIQSGRCCWRGSSFWNCLNRIWQGLKLKWKCQLMLRELIVRSRLANWCYWNFNHMLNHQVLTYTASQQSDMP
jgi:hypothetical protein